MNKTIFLIKLLTIFSITGCGGSNKNNTGTTSESMVTDSEKVKYLKTKLSYVIEKKFKELEEKSKEYDEKYLSSTDNFEKKKLEVELREEAEKLIQEIGSDFVEIAKQLVKQRVSPSDIVDFYCKEYFKYRKQYLEVDKKISQEEKEEMVKVLELYAQSLS